MGDIQSTKKWNCGLERHERGRILRLSLRRSYLCCILALGVRRKYDAFQMQAQPTSLPSELVEAVQAATSIVVLTGAGISAESGIPTFRDAMTGLWARYNPDELATPEAFRRDPSLVTRWYDERRQQAAIARPNPGHIALAQLQRWAKQQNRAFCLVTQTVDRLHQAAGSYDVIELHGTLMVWRCTACHAETEERGGPFSKYPPRCICGGARRPAVVWFGETLPEESLTAAYGATRECDLFFSIGTSSQVYPAAGLMEQAKRAGAKIVEINPTRTRLTTLANWALPGKSGEILPLLVQKVSGEFFEA